MDGKISRMKSCILIWPKKKLNKKNLDLIVANDVTAEGAGFGVDTNIVTLITHEGSDALPKMTKREVADRIWDKALSLRK